jgi:hypothetical protein
LAFELGDANRHLRASAVDVACLFLRLAKVRE